MTLLFSGAAGAQVMPCRYNVTIIEQPCSGTGIYGTAINDQSPPTIAGFYTCGFFTDKPYYWNANDGLVTLSPPPSGSTAVGEGLNNSLQVVGHRESTTTLGFVYQDGQYVILEADGGLHSGAYANNEAGAVVGYRDAADNTRMGFIWQQGKFTNIAPTYTNRCIALDVNSSNQVVGSMGNTTTNSHAILWENGVLNDLGTIPGGFTGSAGAINERGQISINGRVKDPNVPWGVSDARIRLGRRRMDIGSLARAVRRIGGWEYH